MNEAKRKANKKYKEKVHKFTVEVYPSDADIMERLDERAAAGEGKQTYVKRLIREDIEKQ